MVNGQKLWMSNCQIRFGIYYLERAPSCYKKIFPIKYRILQRRSVALIDVAIEELMGGMVLKENAKNNASIHENMEKTSPITNASYLGVFAI
jgi:hypothetical protein